MSEKINTRIKEREELVLKILKEHPEGVALEKLAEMVGITRQTLMKDIDSMVWKGKIVRRKIGSTKLHYHKSHYKRDDFAIEKERKRFQREKTFKNYEKRPINTIFINPSCSVAHEVRKVIECYKLQKEKKEFITEAISMKTNERFDIVVLDTGERIEIETDPKRAKRFDGQDITVIKLWEYKEMESMINAIKNGLQGSQ